MGRRCCIAGCTSSSRLSEHKGVTYHSFPLDPIIRSIWMRNARVNPERQITKSVLVCSRHFRRVDFQPQRSGKYLLKQRVFPTCFPWGKIDPAQVEKDLEEMRRNNAAHTSGNAAVQVALPTTATTSLSTNAQEASKETVEAKVAQIMAETANLSAKSAIVKSTDNSSSAGTDGEIAGNSNAAEGNASISMPAGYDSDNANNRFRALTNFSAGIRLEAKDHQGIWHAARIVEVDNDEREVLIRLERSNKSAINRQAQPTSQEEWISMESNRLRQRIPQRPVAKFDLNEKCMARWSGPRKFPGTISKVLGNDAYEVLFDDGYVKNVRAAHMSRIVVSKEDVLPTATTAASTAANVTVETVVKAAPIAKSPAPTLSANLTAAGKKKSQPLRKDWPLLDISKLDLSTLNLPEVPRDGEWTCHWVNDQPIGKEGFLIVGEHRKPTVIVEDWRLPPGWVKHMYQRSNVLGKWDVILVTPGNKRFRSKSDLKVHLEEQGIPYNPDVYDFSIHRRRAKDIGAYVFTPDYAPQPAVKPKSSAVTATAVPSLSSTITLSDLPSTANSSFLETPVATATPPMELLTVPAEKLTPAKPIVTDAVKMENGHIQIGELKVEIVNNLFRCPHEKCNKNFRKENHVQIHIKHYHSDLAKKLGTCPKMMELAEKRTHTTTTVAESHEQTPKNQIPNQEFFAKLYQQDQQQTRHRKTAAAVSPTVAAESKIDVIVKTEKVDSIPEPMDTTEPNNSFRNSTQTTADRTLGNIKLEEPLYTPALQTKPSRFSPVKRSAGSRRSNRQRTTRRFLTTTHAMRNRSDRNANSNKTFPSIRTADFEDTRHSFNATPDVKISETKKSRGAVLEHFSSIESPITADSGSSSYPPLKTPSSNDAEQDNNGDVQYIKENGQLIKIVRMRQEEIINCICNYHEENGLMIQCDLCLCWQHSICNGFNNESDVPEKYICYICQHPDRGRESHHFKHDQDWLYDGKLATANYHLPNPNLSKRYEFLKKTHTLTGNLLDLNQVMHSLCVKANIARNRAHPKLYLWAKKWDEEPLKTDQQTAKAAADTKPKTQHSAQDTAAVGNDANKRQIEQQTSNGPQPEAAIEPSECQMRLLEHIKVQQDLLWERLMQLEAAVDEIERQDDMADLKDDDMSATKTTVAAYIKDLEVMSQIARFNANANERKAADELKQKEAQVLVQ